MVRLSMALVVGALIAVVGCSPTSTTPGGSEKKANPLHGTWEAMEPALKDITLVIEFTADGKFTRETVIGGLPKDSKVKVDGGKQEGTYQQTDKTLTLKAPEGDKQMTIKELTEAKLTLVNPEGKEMTFTKKK